MKRPFLLLPAVLLCCGVFADVRLPRIFGDNMVLQRDQPIPVWGWANAGEKISIQFNKQIKNVKAAKDGRWMVKLDAEPAGGPYPLTVKGKNQVTLNNVLVGEVWICSGQSNMEMPIAGWGKINHYQQEIAAADYPQIRHFKVPNTVSSQPKDDLEGGDWKICSPETAGDFTATGYFFARELYLRLHIPIGLINTSWGGTMVETWTSREAFEKSDEFKTMIATMPALNLDSLVKRRAETMARLLDSMQQSLDKNSNPGQWKNADYDDSRWPHMKLPGLWEEQGLGGIDGVVWFRKVIDIAEADAGKAATIDLSKIDDSDDSYVNGTKVGGLQNQYSELRHYTIPPGVLKAGKNLIAVRVEDPGGGGGIYGDAADMKLTIGNKTIPLSGDWSFRIESILGGSGSGGVGPNDYPTLLFNAMINPLLPYAIKGAIWYQGETNAGRAYQYRKAFPLMITDWRRHWGLGDFPFYFVQLASFNAGNGNSEHGSSWAELREAQAMTLSLPNTGMAVITDIGESHDIHPKNKQDVGKRLAAIALNNLYGTTMEYSGPVYQSMKTDGNKIIISYTHTGSGLMTKDPYGYIKGFEIAGSDHRFHYAKAYIDGSNIVVYRDDVSSPVAVRYAWADDALEANLFNKEGFPAAPFRSDQWKGITEEAKYAIGK